MIFLKKNYIGHSNAVPTFTQLHLASRRVLGMKHEIIETPSQQGANTNYILI